MGAIFDLDGVLVDSHPVHMRAWKRFLLAIGKTTDDKDLEFILEGRKREDILRHFVGNLTPEQMRLYGEQKELLFQEEASGIRTISGVREFLNQLRAVPIPMAVASCGGSGRVNHLLDILELREYFHAIVTGDDVKEGKPNPSIFKESASRLKLGADTLLVVEDSVSGVLAAKAAEMKCLGIATPARAQQLVEAGADWVRPDFGEVTVDMFCEVFR